MLKQMKPLGYAWPLVLAILLTGCASPAQPSPTTPPPRSRLEAIPVSAVKVTPEADEHPPILHSNEYETPVPLASAVNTAGAEDSVFVLPDGNTLYFFFTPDVNVPVEKQLIDGVTGVYVSHQEGGQWGPAQRVILQDANKESLDGCVFVLGDEMWFGSARVGNLRGVDIWTARFKNGKWTDWQNAGKKLNVDYGLGELHITADGRELYYHSDRPGTQGGYDIWVTRKANSEWQEPENVAAVNTPVTEGWPFIIQNGQELWFTRTYLGTPGIFRSKKVGGNWTEPELIISQFAGEPSLDNAGNIYFTHHFFQDGKMIEADILWLTGNRALS